MQKQYLTPSYLAGVKAGAQTYIRAQLFNASGVAGKMLEVTDGRVTYDYAGAIRKTCQLNISDPTRSLVPELATSAIAPYGQRVKIWMGVKDSLVPMGVFFINEVDADDTGAMFSLSIKGYDQSGKIAKETLTSVYTINGGTNVAVAIQNLLLSREPKLKFNFSPTNYTTPKIILDLNQDCWAAALQMATTVGMDLFFDRNGICTLRPTPNPAKTAMSWIYSDQKSDNYGLMIDELQKIVVADGTVFNDVIVTGETTGTVDVYTGRAQDLNPNSPTYVNGPFGDVPVFFKSTILTSNAQAQSLADAKLRYFLGRADQLTLIGPPNPAQDEEDVVKVVRKALNINSLYTIDKIEFSLAPAGENSVSGVATGTQTLALRKVVK